MDKSKLVEILWKWIFDACWAEANDAVCVASSSGEWQEWLAKIEMKAFKFKKTISFMEIWKTVKYVIEVSVNGVGADVD